MGACLNQGYVNVDVDKKHGLPHRTTLSIDGRKESQFDSVQDIPVKLQKHENDLNSRDWPEDMVQIILCGRVGKYTNMVMS